MSKINPPIKAPYNVIFQGSDLMVQSPFSQPIEYQYNQPTKAPRKTPTNVSQYFLNKILIFILQNSEIISQSSAT